MGKVKLHPAAVAAGLPSISAPAPIRAEHDLSTFDCGDVALNDWLKTRANRGEGRHARTYVVAVDRQVVGYYCTSAGSVERSGTPGKLRRNAPDAVSVSIIGRLAIDKQFGGRGLGSDLLGDAFRRIVSASEVIGIAAVLVHARNDAARAFYMSCADFIEYPAESRTLFLPIETIKAALSAPANNP